VASLTSARAVNTTFELVATQGPAPSDLEPLFAALEPDPPGGRDGVRDLPNQPLEDEPQRVLDDFREVKS
jgi:hypothetical protein